VYILSAWRWVFWKLAPKLEVVDLVYHLSTPVINSQSVFVLFADSTSIIIYHPYSNFFQNFTDVFASFSSRNKFGHCQEQNMCLFKYRLL
jgi:hypothetical protein